MLSFYSLNFDESCTKSVGSFNICLASKVHKLITLTDNATTGSCQSTSNHSLNICPHPLIIRDQLIFHNLNQHIIIPAYLIIRGSTLHTLYICSDTQCF